jgi:predicted PurR-regulated permease PerM
MLPGDCLAQPNFVNIVSDIAILHSLGVRLVVVHGARLQIEEELGRAVEESISTYLITVTGVNIGLGILIGATMYVLGMPNPLLWGVMAGILNFIPYVGSIIGLGAITLAATFSFQQISPIAMVSVSYLLLTALEGNFLTPMLLGKRLTLNPVVVLISVLFWGWLWGALGALLAVPFVASFKIMCDHIDPLSPIGEFLGR